MFVLGIVGSPRKDGNTDILVEEVLAGAAEQGATAEKVRLSLLDIGPCRACNQCRDGECIQQDDMIELTEKLIKADVLVFGTPVYFWGPTAQFKAFIDRWYGIGRSHFQGKHAVLVVPLGDSNEESARPLLDMLSSTVRYQGMTLLDSIVAPNTYERGEAKNNIALMKKARSVGRKLMG